MIRKFLALLFFCSLLYSCGDERQLLFNMEFDTDLQLESITDITETYYYPINNVNTFFSQFSGSLTEDQIGSINPTSCRLVGQFQDIDYDFIREIYIMAQDPNDLLNQQELFYMEFNPTDNNDELELFGSLNNAKHILSEDLMNIEIKIRYRSFPPPFSDHRFTLRFSAFAEQ